MEKGRLKQLLVDYAAGTIDKTDLNILLDYVSTQADDAQLDQLLEELWEATAHHTDLPVDSETLYRRITDHSLFTERITLSKWRYWWGVAAILLVISGSLLFKHWSTDEHINYVMSPPTEVLRTVTTAPSDRPLLRLADGKVIDLDSVSGGLLAMEEGTQITLKGNELHYEGDLVDIDGNVLKNSIITPKGRQYQVLLPDGSRIWLNAATTLTYPVKFGKDKREVEINGEAYFEVKRAKDWPFIVSTNVNQVEVLGTHFNVSAYEDDENAKTTLVEGSVKVTMLDSLPHAVPSRVQRAILKPGQQAVATKGKTTIKVDVIDPEEVVSWKENLFVFNNEEISEVMKKVTRWYDVEVEYLDGMAGKRIGGSIQRFKKIEELMDALVETGLLHYQMKGGMVVIMK